ncbi:MAG: DUF4232 domain-containing protein [Catenulispora sp.]|nr:DUF4232 domain-containing protein [Catenulispora sp.]
MTNRISTPNKHLLAIAAIAGSALIGLTACASDTKTNATAATTVASTPAVGAPSPNQSASNQPSQPSQTPTQTQAQAGASTVATAPSATKTTATTAPKPTAAKTTKPAAPPADPRPTDCTPTQLKATVTNLTRPINHVLLTVTNTGKTTCNLYYYPDLRFDADQQSVTQAVEGSKPQAVVTIAPGESGYAAIGTSAADGSGGAGKVEKQVEVFLETRDQSGSLPGSLVLPLPANTYVDDSAFVTYWQSDLQSAVVW